MADYLDFDIGGGMPVRLGDKVWFAKGDGLLVMFTVRSVLELDALLETWLVDCEGNRYDPSKCFTTFGAAAEDFVESASRKISDLYEEIHVLGGAIENARWNLRHLKG